MGTVGSGSRSRSKCGATVGGAGSGVVSDLGYDGVITAWHCNVIVAGRLLTISRVAIEEWEQGFVSLVVKMMNPVPPRKKVGDSLWWWFVGDGTRNNVDHIPRISLGGKVVFRFRIKATGGGEVNVAAQNGNANGVGSGKGLQAEDQVLAFFFVLARGVVVVQVIEEVDLTVEVVEEAASQAESFVQQANGSNDGRGEKILQPDETGVGDRHT